MFFFVSDNIFEIDDQTRDVVVSRKLKNKDAKCHIDLLRIDEDDIEAFSKDFSSLLNSQIHKGVNFMIGFAFENIAIMALELKELLKKTLWERMPGSGRTKSRNTYSC